MTIALTLSNGEHVELEVLQVEFVMHCKYHRCKVKFKTIDSDQIYCTSSHKVQASKHRCALRELGILISRR